MIKPRKPFIGFRGLTLFASPKKEAEVKCFLSVDGLPYNHYLSFMKISPKREVVGEAIGRKTFQETRNRNPSHWIKNLNEPVAPPLNVPLLG